MCMCALAHAQKSRCLWTLPLQTYCHTVSCNGKFKMFSHHQHRLAAANGLDQESSSFPLIAAVAAYLDGMAVGVSTLETMEAAL